MNASLIAQRPPEAESIISLTRVAGILALVFGIITIIIEVITLIFIIGMIPLFLE